MVIYEKKLKLPGIANFQFDISVEVLSRFLICLLFAAAKNIEYFC